MSLSIDDIKKYSRNPDLAQKLILEHIESASNGEVVISDPTSPFIMALETSLVSGANAINETISNHRKQYPKLANKIEDLYHHMSDDELSKMFATPDAGVFNLFLNVTKIRNEGILDNTGTFKKLTVPAYTKITISNNVFTLLNDIHIKYYIDNGSFEVEQDLPASEVGYENLGILDSSLISDTDSNDWLTFQTVLKQVSITTYEEKVVLSEGFVREYELTGSYYYSEIYMYSNNEWVKINKTHSDIMFDKNNPTAHVLVGDNTVSFSIPDMYFINGNISSKLKVEVYETNGGIVLPVAKFKTSEFQIDLGVNTNSVHELAVKNVDMLASSTTMLGYGSDPMTLEELKEAIIYNTTNIISTPITDKELEATANEYGYELYKALDVVTQRLYVASKNIGFSTVNETKARADIYVNTVRNVLSDLEDNDSVLIEDTNILIKSGTLFKEDNGVISIVSNAERNLLENNTDVVKNNLINNNNYFYTPYHYILDKTNTVVNSRIYSLDNPVIHTPRIISKNDNLPYSVNISSMSIAKTSSGYRVTINVVGNSDFNNIHYSSVFAQLKITANKTKEPIYLDAQLTMTDRNFVFDIVTDFYVDFDNGLNIENGRSSLSSKRLPLDNTVEFVMFVKDYSYEVFENYEATNLITLDDVSGINALTLQYINLNFGKELEHLWNKVTTDYLPRTYLTYDEDVPLTYTSDVFDIDDTSGQKFTFDRDPGTNEVIGINYVKSHAKGDVVLDENNEVVLLHSAGDTVLDESNNPVIDQNGGIVRFIDIVMLEYEFKAATYETNTNYLLEVLSTIDTWLEVDMVSLNKNVLEQTEILYRPFKKSLPVSVIINKTTTALPYKVSPEVTLYIDNDKEYSSAEISALEDTIGKLIHNNIEKDYVKISDIKTDIMNTITDNIVAVKITGIGDTSKEYEVFKLSDVSNRVTINKKMDFTITNKTTVRYDINLNIEKV